MRRLSSFQVGTALALSLLLGACAHGPPIPGGRAWLHPLSLQPAGAVDWTPAQGEGRVVLIQFMTTWCLPCLQQQPALEALRTQFEQDGLQIVWVGMDLEGALVLEPFAEQLAPEWPVLIADQALIDGQTLYGRVKELPQTVLLGRDGKPVGAWYGVASPAKIEPHIRRAIAQ